MTGERLTGIDLSVTSDHEDRMVVLPLSEILQVMLRHCREKYADRIELLFNHKVTNVGYDRETAWATVQAGTADEEKRTLKFEADYLIGCDGGKSVVRTTLFQRNWPGETFKCQLLVQNVSLAQSKLEV